MSSLQLPVLDGNKNSNGQAPGEQSITIALAGNPNAGKTTLFNRLTGLRAKTANYPGTTVDVRSARLAMAGKPVDLIDLPGLYGMTGGSPEEQLAAEVIEGIHRSDHQVNQASVVVLVVDATHLARNLYLAGQVREKARRVLIALNMTDLASRDGIEIDPEGLAQELGAPVIPISARTGEGVDRLQRRLEQMVEDTSQTCGDVPEALAACSSCTGCPHAARFSWADQVISKVSNEPEHHLSRRMTEKIDHYLTHPLVGLLAFAAIMVLLFQSIFWLADMPMTWIDESFASLGETMTGLLPEGLIQSFVVDGVVAGLGGTVIFIPQICILFFLLALLEDTGYLARAAFVMDRWMSKVGLPGKAFIPMLSAHACAIPAIMSTRVIENRRDRLATILVLPLLTCSARIPVYVMVTAMLFGGQPLYAGLLFAGAYALGIIAAFTMSFVLKGTILKGHSAPLVLELPTYKWPNFRNALLTTIDRGWLFLRKAGTVILGISIVLWALSAFPMVDEANLPADVAAEVTLLNQQAQAASEEAAAFEAAGDQVQAQGRALVAEGKSTEADNLIAQYQQEQSIIGTIGKTVQPVFAPMGFDWEMSVGVMTSFAAREVVASTLSVLYGMGEGGAENTELLGKTLNDHISVPAGLALLVFFVLAMQCLPTQVVTRRETGSWKWSLLQFGYMTVLAYSASALTYQVASMFI